MKLFDATNHTRTQAHREIHAYAALAYTLVDFTAALMFIIGSVLFFDKSTVYTGTWLFLIGSICFALRPTITLLREIAYIRLGDYQDAAGDLRH